MIDESARRSSPLPPTAVVLPPPIAVTDAHPAAPVSRLRQAQTQAVMILMGLACLVALQWGRPVLVPIALAMLISYAVEPMIHRLVVWRLPRPFAASLVFAGTLAAVGALGYVLSGQLASAADRLPSAAQELRQAFEQRRRGEPSAVAKVQEAANELQKLSGADVPLPGPATVATVAIEKQPFDLSGYVWQGSLSLTTVLGDAVVILFLAFYLSLAGNLFRRRLVEIAGPTLSQKKITLQILDAINLQIARYLFVRTVISGLVAAGTFVAFWAIGMAEPAVWGVAAGLFNVVPYVGPLAVIAAAGIAGFVQFHTVAMGALAAGLASVIALLEGYAVTPWLLSRTAEMNPAVVLIGLLFWGWLWGLPGLFLAIPILMVIKAVSDHIEAFHPVATLLKG